jgi:hypothetical protein
MAATPAPAQTSADYTTTAGIVQSVHDADPLEFGEPLASEPVTVADIGPHADERYNVPGLGDVLAGQHAQDRHGQRALIARLAMMTGGYQRYDCKDGRTRLIKQLAPKLFAVIIIEAGVEVSAFTGDHPQSFYDRVLQRDGCLPPGGPFGGWATAN